MYDDSSNLSSAAATFLVGTSSQGSNEVQTVVAGALGECVHVAGVNKFLRLAEAAGWRTIFLGPAVPIKKFLQVARDEDADMIAVSYRLTPDTGERLLADFAEEADDLPIRLRWNPTRSSPRPGNGLFRACF